MNHIGQGLAAGLSSIVLSSLVLALPAKAQGVSTQPSVTQLVVVAKKTVKRSYRRSRARAAPKKNAEPASMPLPRPKPEETDAAALPDVRPATPAPEASASPAGLPTVPKNPSAARAELRALYAVTVLGDRCNFPISTREGAALDHSVTAIETALKLDTQEADAIYSDVDLSLAAKAKICQPSSAEAKAFRVTLDRLLGH